MHPGIIKHCSITLLSALLGLSTQAAPTPQEITSLPAGAQASTLADASHFTGTAHIDSRFQRAAPARIGGALVRFEPGARTAWHSHPLGQTLFITEGTGWVQAWGQAPQPMHKGDVIWIPPGVKHWHGASASASASSAMSHFAVAESLDGKAVVWMEQVSKTQYPVQ